MRLSLSKKEVAEIHLMLTTLPIPPIPVVLTMVYEHLEDSELKAAFEMATSSLVKDSLSDDGIVNSHSIFAALSFFVKWSASTGDNSLKKQEEMQHKKDASLLRIISSVLDYSEKVAKNSNMDTKDDDILQIFITASQEWINTYLPDNISVTIRPAPNNKTIGFEHDLHIAMAHYCYSQGVLYNSKNSSLMCKVHDGLYNDFLENQKNATEDDAADKIVNGETNGTTTSTLEHMEIAAMYSQFPYHKMMLLSFDRLLQDCLYGHTTPDSGPSVQQNARDLLKMSFANYKTMTSKTAALPSSKSTPSSTSSACITKDPIFPEASKLITVDVDGGTGEKVSETLAPLADTPVVSISTPVPLLESEGIKSVETPIDQQESGPSVDIVAKKSCAADMGSYKSSIGIFVLGIAIFLQKDDPYFMQNMSTSLRHLSEMMVHGNDKTREACLMINIPQLIKLVRSNMDGLSKSGTMFDIEETLLEIEQTLLAKQNTPGEPIPANNLSVLS